MNTRMMIIGVALTFFCCLFYNVSEAGDIPIPEFYGLYALEKGKLIELDDKDKFYQFDENVKFILYSKVIALSGSNGFTIRKFLYARNVISKNFNGSPRVDPYNKWVVSSDEPVKTHSKPIPHQPEQIYLAPKEPFQMGVYVFEMGSSPIAYFSVGKSADELQSSTACVDVEAAMFSAMVVGSHGKEIPCGSNTTTNVQSIIEDNNPKNRAGKQLLGLWQGSIYDESSKQALSMTLTGEPPNLSGKIDMSDVKTGMSAKGTVSNFSYNSSGLSFNANLSYGGEKPYRYSCSVKLQLHGDFGHAGSSEGNLAVSGSGRAVLDCDFMDPKKGKQHQSQQGNEKFFIEKVEKH